MEKSYKFRIYPTESQKLIIKTNIDCSRFVYNYYLDKRKQKFESNKIKFSNYECCKDLTCLKKNHEWLKEADSHALQKSLKQLDDAYNNFFQNKSFRYPKFKSRKHTKKTYTTTNNKNAYNNNTIRIIDSNIQLPKLGLVKCRISKQVRGRILSATVSQNPSGKYFVALCCTDIELDQLPETGKKVGIDLGIKDLAITSDGDKYPNHKYLKQSEKKLAKLQRQLSRKTSDSKRREKTRIKVARLHEHVANQRRDMMQKLTTDLIRKYDTICIEDLNASGMVKNHKLAKAVSDASFYEFRRELKYKAKWYGKEVIVIDRFFPSSQTCSSCGAQWKALKDLSQRSWICPSCLTYHDRDVNASMNILKEGLKSVS